MSLGHRGGVLYDGPSPSWLRKPDRRDLVADEFALAPSVILARRPACQSGS